MAVTGPTSAIALLSMLGFLYGIFLCLFSSSTYLLIKRQRHLNALAPYNLRKPVWKTVPFIASILFFVTITPVWLMNVFDALQAFLSSHGGPSLYFSYSELGSLTNAVTFTVLTQLVGIIGDTVMVFRLYILWDRSKRVIVLPLLCVSGLLVCDALIDDLYVKTIRGPFDIQRYYMQLDQITPANCGIILFTNLYCCVLISWKLYRHIPVQPQRGSGTRPLTNILTILIESAALYVGFVTVYVGAYATGGASQVLFGLMIVPITGIAFTLINLRVGLKYAGDRLPATKGSGRYGHNHASRPTVIESFADETIWG